MEALKNDERNVCHVELERAVTVLLQHVNDLFHCPPVMTPVAVEKKPRLVVVPTVPFEAEKEEEFELL